MKQYVFSGKTIPFGQELTITIIITADHSDGSFWK